MGFACDLANTYNRLKHKTATNKPLHTVPRAARFLKSKPFAAAL